MCVAPSRSALLLATTARLAGEHSARCASLSLPVSLDSSMLTLGLEFATDRRRSHSVGCSSIRPWFGVGEYGTAALRVRAVGIPIANREHSNMGTVLVLYVLAGSSGNSMKAPGGESDQSIDLQPALASAAVP